MTREREPKLTSRMQGAVDELKMLVRSRYPDATFRVARSPEDAKSIDIWTSVDLDEPDQVMDLVTDRVLELLVEEELPVHVVPVRTPQRAAKVRADQLKERQLASGVPVDIAAV